MRRVHPRHAQQLAVDIFQERYAIGQRAFPQNNDCKRQDENEKQKRKIKFNDRLLLADR